MSPMFFLSKFLAFHDKENKNCDLLLKKLPTDVVNNIKTFFKTGYYLIKN